MRSRLGRQPPNDADAVADYHDLCFRDTYASQLLAGEFEVPVLDGTPIDHFTVSGHTDYELHARVENVEAIAFYKKAGWTVTDRLIHTVEHGISYDEHVLVKTPPCQDTAL
jgi:hypothetical protein